jgi:UDP-N-acetylmuramyl pentapeptide phosphotransferase/UDP-N-acetylglucosamine-1-phosphate transferase
MSSTPLLAASIAFLMALALVRLLWSERLASLVLDRPNERSLHVRPTPRTGGVGIMLAVALTLLVTPGAPLAIVVPAVVLAAIFLADDVGGLPVPVRFGAQLLAAITFLVWSGPYALWLLPMLAVGTVWCMNLYNFMDGSNGLAGGMAVLGFGTLALASWQAGAPDLTLLAAVIAGAAAGFLVWNFDPARIFLGDAGSIPLGFLAAAIGIEGWRRGAWPFWLPLLAFSPFVVDATVTLLRRIARGEKPWEAHRTHYYQRLIRSGAGHRRVALMAYGVMLLAGGSALSHRTAPTEAVGVHLLFWAAIYVAIAVVVDRRWAAAEAATLAAERQAAQSRADAAQ